MTSTTSSAAGAAHQRSTVRSVALAAEHGGWGLTAEPVLLGLLIAPSWAGLALGAAAMTAFVARTPIKIGLGDLRRGRRLDRTQQRCQSAQSQLQKHRSHVSGRGAGLPSQRR